MKNDKPFAVVDCETNPFNKGIPVSPFVWGFYDGSSYFHFWGENSRQELLDFLRSLETPLIIYGHNAGKFDWLFIADQFRGNIKIIGSRIVQAFIGIHEFRDSFANIPVPLADFGGKKEIDYEIMEPFVRERPGNRRLIEEYLKQDCVGLWHAIARYREMFGNALTMPSASMRQLNIMCNSSSGKDAFYERMTPEQDAVIRPFFYGGRVECFKQGVLENGNFKIFDVTSMYPAVMRNHAHPVSGGFIVKSGSGATIDADTDFAEIEAYSEGALPVRTKTGLRFSHGSQRFYGTGAEIRMAVSLGKLTIRKVFQTSSGTKRFHFQTFVDHFFSQRQQAILDGDMMLKLFYKLVMNSAYGKFAQNPDDYKDMIALQEGELPDGPLAFAPENRSLPQDHPRRKKLYSIAAAMPGITIWARPAKNPEKSFINVATAASITGYARASLMEGLANATNPIYCDTDCIICDDLSNVPIGSGLGEWKLECEGDTIAIAGKKQYSLFSGGKCVKLASKGVRLTPDEIWRIANGETIEYTQNAPMLKWTKDTNDRQILSQKKLVRNVKNTAKVEQHA
jgi:hypothetical protein